MKESGTKEPAVDFTAMASGGDAKQSTQAHNQVITEVLLNTGEWIKIIKGSFNLYKTFKGVPFVEFKVPTLGNELDAKTIQVFPATVAGWAFYDE